MKRILTGIQPTNDLTIGNYFGSILPLKKNIGNNECLLFVADMHSITLGNFDKKNLVENKKNVIKCYLASGLTSDNIFIFNQSQILETCNLNHILTCCSSLGDLYRMTQFKDKSEKTRQQNGTEKIPTGLLTYPILMASDILLFNADLVVVGKDQKQHLELTKNLAIKLNKILKENIIKVPEVQIDKVANKIMDLQNPEIKMSKSNENKKGVIFLNDDINESLKKIKSAKTDNYNQVKYDLINQPGVSNLMVIYSCLTNKTLDEIQKQFEGCDYKIFKDEICNKMEFFLNDFQNKYKKITDTEIKNCLQTGYIKAKSIAKQNLKNIFDKIGFEYEG